jgi:KUP system potassium uptake protein
MAPWVGERRRVGAEPPSYAHLLVTGPFSTAAGGAETHSHPAGKIALAVGALGIVYGDIGTSPIYALREAFHHHDLAVDKTNAYGVASIVFWSLVVIISIKYLLLVMKADNKGEGGILALTALVMPRRRRSGDAGDGTDAGRDHRATGALVAVVTLGVFGTALLYGDGLITPAISVLSAVEGFEVATTAAEDWVLPAAVIILVLLFAVQKRGTAGIARVFGPVMVLWFAVLAVLGLAQIVEHPGVIEAVLPNHAVELFSHQPVDAFLALGSIFLVVTGGEALYADMGHFGRRPIQLSWYGWVFPALVLNYFGQAALLVEEPEAIETSPFYELAPDWAITPLAVLATLATVIASQALISGAFSLTAQAIQLDYIPRLEIRHTSSEHSGQIYVPLVNWLLMLGCVGLVLGFRSSSALASAYGIAVTATMAITTLLFYRVARLRFGWSPWKARLILAPLFAVDLAFLLANIPKIPHGGWFPLLVAMVLVIQMTTWRRGRDLVSARLRRAETPIAEIVARVDGTGVARVPGTAVYLFKDPFATPTALLVNLQHHTVLHERILLVAIQVSESPTIPVDERLTVHEIGSGFFQVIICHGFMEDSNLVAALDGVEIGGERFDAGQVTYFLGDELVIAGEVEGMHPWREQLFVLLDRGADSASRFFKLPADRVVTVGTHVEI